MHTEIEKAPDNDDDDEKNESRAAHSRSTHKMHIAHQLRTDRIAAAMNSKSSSRWFSYGFYACGQTDGSAGLSRQWQHRWSVTSQINRLCVTRFVLDELLDQPQCWRWKLCDDVTIICVRLNLFNSKYRSIFDLFEFISRRFLTNHPQFACEWFSIRMSNADACIKSNPWNK